MVERSQPDEYEVINPLDSDRYPPMPAFPEFLQQTVAWSEDDQPVSLAEYISTTNASLADSLGLSSVDKTLVFQSLPSPDEIRKMTVHMLSNGRDDIAFSFGYRNYTKSELIPEIENDTEVGRIVLQSTYEHSQLMRDMADKGKFIKFNGDPQQTTDSS